MILVQVLTYKGTVPSGSQSDFLSHLQLSLFHLRLWVPEGPGIHGSVPVGYFH